MTTETFLSTSGHLLLIDTSLVPMLCAGVDDLAWREAVQRAGGPDNPDRLWPVLAAGLSDLRSREAAQVSCVSVFNGRSYCPAAVDLPGHIAFCAAVTATCMCGMEIFLGACSASRSST